ncbi:hypothetical protein [Bacillus phage Juan]|uniref:Uncharacterized protein n=1 Tax=Bacillus phage Juan TaxID=2023949 RepID=A0A223LI86_9CAUD|nr:hypothetical protein H3012_gp18 [Bacillus phage Juan]ASU04107.1 hypothetical protein [Bacillus phage Juan]
MKFSELLHKELMWNKELVQISYEDEEGNCRLGEIKRLEFHYEEIENDFEVLWFEPLFDKDLDRCYMKVYIK